MAAAKPYGHGLPTGTVVTPQISQGVLTLQEVGSRWPDLIARLERRAGHDTMITQRRPQSGCSLWRISAVCARVWVQPAKGN